METVELYIWLCSIMHRLDTINAIQNSIDSSEWHVYTSVLRPLVRSRSNVLLLAYYADCALNCICHGHHPNGCLALTGIHTQRAVIVY